MGIKSRMEYPSKPFANEIILQKSDEYVARGLTAQEAADLIQIDIVENENSAYVPLSEAEKRRKKMYLEKMSKDKE